MEAEPEQALPALALGDVDLVLADEWEHQPHSLPAGVHRYDLHRDLVHIVLPEGHPAAGRHDRAIPLAELAGEVWTTGHRGTAWEEMTQRTCRQLGGFDPNISHRTNDAVVSLGLVAEGLAVTLLPELVDPGRPSRCGGARHRGRARAADDLRGHSHSRRPPSLRPGAARRRPGRRGRARLTYGAAGTPGLSFCSA